MNIVKQVGKYLDQPLLVGKFTKAVPKVMLGSSILYTLYETKNAPKGERKRIAINTGIVLGFSTLAALAAPKISAKCVGQVYEKVNFAKIKSKNAVLVDEFVGSNGNIFNKKVSTILDKAKEKVLNFKEIKILSEFSEKHEPVKKLFNKLIPEPDNITSKEIFGQIGRLSVMGAVPVGGGIVGGITADRVTDKKNWKSKVPNKVKEGVYQYLANIFLCNIGAAGALSIMESRNIKSKSARAIAMVSGIMATGVIGGSSIANYISKKAINPIFDKQKKCKEAKKICPERKPELLDICLHTDDIATVAVMSGLKWIEPALPILYGISGYRAGIGYRNGDESKK